MKKLFFLALLGLIFITQGAFAASAPNTYPSCYKGYGSTSPNYNGTNGDNATWKGWCIDGYGVLEPRPTTTDSTNPNIQGGIAVPVSNFNVGPNAGGTSVPAVTFDALIAQQTGNYVVDYGGFSTTATIDTLKGIGGHYVLPPAMPGEEITILSASQSVITVDTLNTAFALTEGLIYPNADTIEFSPNGVGMTSGQNLKSPGNAGAEITLVSNVVGQWQVTNQQGQIGNVSTSDSLWTVISTQ